MKPAKCFAVVACVYRSGWQVMAITSENRGRVFGRDVGHDGATNRAMRDVLGRFDTQDQAEASVMAMHEIDAAHAPLIHAAEKALTAATQARKDARRDAMALHVANAAQGTVAGACDKP